MGLPAVLRYVGLDERDASVLGGEPIPRWFR